MHVGLLEIFLMLFGLFIVWVTGYFVGKGAGFKEGLREGDRIHSKSSKGP